jgi:hypothetical protein
MKPPSRHQAPRPRWAERGQSLDLSRFPTVREVLRGYLHQDFLAEYGSAEAAVLAFCRDASPAAAGSLVFEWRALSAATAGWRIGEIADLLTRDLGGSWAPRSRREFTRVSDALASLDSGLS